MTPGTLGPMTRLSRSWSLFTSSWRVIRSDKELVLLPAISAVVALLCVAPFLGGAFLASGASLSALADSDVDPGALSYVLLFLAYLIGAFVTIFFQSALILGANERLSGGNPTLSSALSGATSRIGHILQWAFVSATVSVVLNWIQDRAGFVGRIVVGMIGLAWTLVTFLVLPILVIEGVGVGDAFKRSAGAFKRTWGENVVGNAGISVVGVLAVLAGMLVLGPVAWVGVDADMPVVVIGAIALFVVWVLVVSVVTTALTGVFQTALYRYAVVGEEPAGFTHDQIAGAFRPKRSLMRRGATTA